MINIAQPMIGREEVEAVNAVLASGILAQGPKVAELEQAFAAYCGTKFAVAVNSGTAAIHSALYALNIGPGDEVITTPFSFIATINPILAVGAKPILVDIDPVTYNIDPQKITAAVTEKTKAIMPVHLYGQPCDWEQIHAVAAEYGLFLIEDACQAVGADYAGKKTGNLGDVGCFSLYATKNIMSGEGGVITTNDKNIADTARRFRQHGMTGPYEYTHFGLNYRMSDLHAAIAVEQLKKVELFNSRRKENAALYDTYLKDISGLLLPATAKGRSHVFHQYTISIEKTFGSKREDVLLALKDADIVAGVYYPKPLHYYEHIARLGYKPGDFPVAEKAALQALSLPVHPGVSKADVKNIADVIIKVKSER